MFSFVKRGLSTAAILAAGGAMAGGGLAAPATAASVPRSDPTITIRVGSIRTAENGPPGPPTASGLAGTTFRVAPSSAGLPDTCVSTAAGLCTLSVNGGRTYTITQVGAPSGWFASSSLTAGTAGQVTSRVYDTLSVAVGTGNVTIPVPAPNSDTSPTARSGTWALSRDDPPLPDGCGLRIALLIDLSSSITQAILPTYKAAARAFVESLEGTPSSIAIYTFGTTGPAPGANNATLAPVSVADQAGVATLVRKLDGLTVPAGSGTNWDAGFWQIVRDMPAYHYQSAIIITDGDPTYYGPPGSLGGRGNLSRFAETENGIFSANALKKEGASVLGVGIGTSKQGLRYTDNIRAVSGPIHNTDYFNTDFETLSAVLANLALRNCAGLRLAKKAAPAIYAHAGEKITYTYTVTNPKYLTLHHVRVSDDRIAAAIPCTPSTLATGETATCTATYIVTQADVDAGHVTNAAKATGTTPNDDRVSSPPADVTVTAIRTPGIHLVKSAFPAEYAEPGKTIYYTYTVANTGNVILHNIALTDDRLGTITCPAAMLPPAASMACHATHTTTTADVDSGHISNTATVTGQPPTGPPVTDGAEEIIDAQQAPNIKLVKSAFPTEYRAPGEIITYTYTVTNTGNVTLRHVTVTDDKLHGPVACLTPTLSPGESTTCEATHAVTKADVADGHITNAGTATGDPPAGPPVTDDDTVTVEAIRTPGIELAKSAFPASYGAPGETVIYSYVAVNTGDVTLHDVTVTDHKIPGPIACPAGTLDPGDSMTCHATHIITAADLAAGHITNVGTVTGDPPAGPPVTDKSRETIDAIHRPGIQVAKSASPTTYRAAGEAIAFTYTVVNTGDVTLHDVAVTDDKIPGPIACLADRLAPGKATTCHAVYTITATDVIAGYVANVATATGRPPTGPPLTDRDEETVTLVALPVVSVTG